MRCTLITFFFLSLLLACSKKKEEETPFEPRQAFGAVDKKLREASGIVASVANPRHLWTHNDGGNKAEIFLINEKAETVMTCKLKNIINRDWEDITIGRGPKEGINYLYIADIGDNDGRYAYKMLYRIEEPALSDKEIEIEKIDTLLIQLADRPRDTEAIMVDPITNNFYLITKREHQARLYEIKFPFAGDTLKAEPVITFPFNHAVAANISSDGNEVLIKSYQHIYYWKRNTGEAFLQLMEKEPVQLNYRTEPQGESIAWSQDGTGFYTLSESEKGTGGNLYFYKRK